MASTTVAPLKFVTVAPKTSHSATVVFIHGLGDNGRSWTPVADMFQQDPALRHIKWIFPHATEKPVTANGGMIMPSWFDIYSFGFKDKEDEEGLLLAAKSLQDLINNEISTTSVDAKRIVIGGFSQGGVMALLTGLSAENKLAGIVGLSCYLPVRNKFQSLTKSALYDTPIFVGHGTHDPLIQPILFEQSLVALKAIGVADVKEGSTVGLEHHTYPGMGHSTCPEELGHLATWMKKVLPA